MEIKDFLIEYTKADSKFKFYNICDIHGGTIHCVEKKINNLIQNRIAKERNSYWWGGGDYGELILPNDKRFDPSQKSIAEWVKTDNIVECQRQWISHLLSPIKKKCIGLGFGNHEDDIRMHHHNNVHQNICDDLGVDNLGFSYFIRLFFRRKNSSESHIKKIAVTHGAGWAVTKGAKLNKLNRFADDFEADGYVFCHTHDLIADAKPYMTTTPAPFGQAKLKEAKRWLSLGGSWFRTYTQGIQASYGEKKVYPPTVIGCACFIIDPNKGSMDIELLREEL